MANGEQDPVQGGPSQHKNSDYRGKAIASLCAAIVLAIVGALWSPETRLIFWGVAAMNAFTALYWMAKSYDE